MTVPHSATLHAGYARHKISLYKNSDLAYVSAIPSGTRGGSRVDTNFGWGAVDAAASAREVRAGRVVPVSPRLRADDGAVRLRLARKFPALSTVSGNTAATWRAVRTAKPCGPGRRCYGQAGSKMCASPTGWTASSNSNGEGGQRKVRLPGEHGISRPTIAQGRPSVRLHLYAAVRSSCATSCAAVRGCESAPGLPCALLDLRV